MSQIYWDFRKRENYTDRKRVSGCPRLDVELRIGCRLCMELLGGDGSILKLDCENGCRIVINLIKILILSI